MLKEFKMILNEEEYKIVYDDDINIIKEMEKYDSISKEELEGYCECHDRKKKITIDEYQKNADVVIAIYKEITSERGLQKLIKTFPKRRNKLLDKKRMMPICKCMNAIPLIYTTSCGYICNELRVITTGNRTLKLEYVRQKFMF